MALVAATFAVTSMQRSNELVRIDGCGDSEGSSGCPVVGRGGGRRSAGGGEPRVVLPEFRDKLTRDAGAQLAGGMEELTPRYDRLTDIRLAGKYALRSERGSSSQRSGCRCISAVLAFS
jgi:hypothetical protein